MAGIPLAAGGGGLEGSQLPEGSQPRRELACGKNRLESQVRGCRCGGAAADAGCRGKPQL